MPRYIARMIVGIMIGLLPIKSQGRGIMALHIVGTGTSPE